MDGQFLQIHVGENRKHHISQQKNDHPTIFNVSLLTGCDQPIRTQIASEFHEYNKTIKKQLLQSAYVSLSI